MALFFFLMTPTNLFNSEWKLWNAQMFAIHPSTFVSLPSPWRVCFHRWPWSAAVGQRRQQQQDGSVVTQKTGAFSTWTWRHLIWNGRHHLDRRPSARPTPLSYWEKIDLWSKPQNLGSPTSQAETFPSSKADCPSFKLPCFSYLSATVSFSWSMASPAEALERGPWLRGLLFSEAISWQWDGSPCRTSVYLKPELFFTQQPQISASEFTSDHNSRCVLCAGLELY